MQIRKSQKCAGNKVFDNIILEKMIATNLDFHIICNRSFSEYMTDIMFLSDKPFKDYIINKSSAIYQDKN
ncbi:hypothetical protein CEXT_362281 [Caerostris extrusa]|uniref:Uncharacterized protein n=1 Tax=Caerostris extrusa TaxID=172846 RepID=A0AAV4RDI3_CAEEX|nr:hypothetical protein CEXT_362281 [Caerostris extrusa]